MYIWNKNEEDEIVDKTMIKNEKHYWINPDGFIIRAWSQDEYSSLLPTDKIKVEVYEKCCPCCGKHYKYCTYEEATIRPSHYCEECRRVLASTLLGTSYISKRKFPNKNKGYRQVIIKLRCLQKYEYYNEEFNCWIPKLNLNN